MELAEGHENSSPSEEGLASERLRKAIERNRKKQQEREQMQEKMQGSPSLGTQTKRPPPSMSLQNISRSEQLNHSTRQSVATADNVSFTNTIKNSTRRFGEILDYGNIGASNSSATTRKRWVDKERWMALLLKMIWGLFFFLLLRLIFVDRGIWDYYQRNTVLENKLKEYRSIEKENTGLRREINKIRDQVDVQKKLVRDHLGFIAEDEYLILFPKESDPPSTSN